MILTLEEAKSIPVHIVVEDMGGRYSHTSHRGEAWYFSPFRPDENSASFKIDPKKNTWHDFGRSETTGYRGEGNGGDTVDLWCDLNGKHRRFGIPEAREALTKFKDFAFRGEGGLQVEQAKKSPVLQNQQPRYEIVKIYDKIKSQGLLNELNRRRISLNVADRYLKQGLILDTVTQKKFTAFLFENDKQGYECIVPNPKKGNCFRTCIGTKAATRIMSDDDTTAADIFEGVWDFLSWLEMKAIVEPINHSYVLNSVVRVNEVCEKISAFEGTLTHVFLFMDNDQAGVQAKNAITEKLKENFHVGGMEHLYKDYKDLNEFRVKHGGNPMIM